MCRRWQIRWFGTCRGRLPTGVFVLVFVHLAQEALSLESRGVDPGAGKGDGLASCVSLVQVAATVHHTSTEDTHTFFQTGSGPRGGALEASPREKDSKPKLANSKYRIGVVAASDGDSSVTFVSLVVFAVLICVVVGLLLSGEGFRGDDVGQSRFLTGERPRFQYGGTLKMSEESSAPRVPRRADGLLLHDTASPSHLPTGFQETMSATSSGYMNRYRQVSAATESSGSGVVSGAPRFQLPGFNFKAGASSLGDPSAVGPPPAFRVPPPLSRDLVLPLCESWFAISFAQMEAEGPFDIFGLSGKPLLRANIQSVPGGRGSCVSISMNPNRPPLGSIVNMGGVSQPPFMEVKGAMNQPYGELRTSDDINFVLTHGRETVARVAFDPFRSSLFLVSTEDGSQLACASKCTDDNPYFAHDTYLEVRVSAGMCPALSLLTVMGVLVFGSATGHTPVASVKA
mmetsp:Transcript_107669/g.303293  ORF Transcript_107669/g.303293 Transcript_107669/m.303293 type:complete len:457 (+) Transcript_107669:92-1462(+)